MHHQCMRAFQELVEQIEEEAENLTSVDPAGNIWASTRRAAMQFAEMHRQAVMTFTNSLPPGTPAVEDDVSNHLATRGLYMKGACVEPAANTIQMQGYDANCKMIGCSTRSSFDVSRDMGLMDAAWMFDGAARRGVAIVDHRIGDIVVSTVVDNKTSAKPDSDGWLPMMTAPRDGTTILLRFGSDGWSQGRWNPHPGNSQHPWEIVDTNSAKAWFINRCKTEFGPSHWKLP